jgi:hypothetical protein
VLLSFWKNLTDIVGDYQSVIQFPPSFPLFFLIDFKFSVNFISAVLYNFLFLLFCTKIQIRSCHNMVR